MGSKKALVRLCICPGLSEPGPEIIKLLQCSTHLSTKFQLLIKTKIPTLAFSLSDVVLIMLINVKIPKIVGIQLQSQFEFFYTKLCMCTYMFSQMN